MLAIILKDLRSYTSLRRYRLIQFTVLGVLALVLFVSAVEFYAQGIATQQDGNSIDVGKKTYTLFVLCLFLMQFLVPKHAVDAVDMERNHVFLQGREHGHSGNEALLALTPLTNWRILAGKWAAVVIWGVWGIWLTIPLIALSSYIGGLAISQLVKCGVVILMSCPFFALVGMGVALWNPAVRAKGISYGIVLAITFLPLLPITPFTDISLLRVMSPFCALLSIIGSDPTSLWIWNVCLLCVLCLVIFPVVVRLKS